MWKVTVGGGDPEFSGKLEKTLNLLECLRTVPRQRESELSSPKILKPIMKFVRLFSLHIYDHLSVCVWPLLLTNCCWQFQRLFGVIFVSDTSDESLPGMVEDLDILLLPDGLEHDGKAS